MQLRLGILIIGSLLWDVHGTDKSHRASWQQRLDLAHRYFVRAPIRYGRQSEYRSYTFSMVFSQLCDGNNSRGQAVLVPLRNPISSPQDLVDEAKALWSAEQKDPQSAKAPVHTLSANWGCVGLIGNPHGSGIPAQWLTAWKSEVRANQRLYGHVTHATSEASAVDGDGMLCIRWPEAMSGSSLVVPVDAILATATDPKIVNGGYCDASAIAAAWNSADPKWSQYFWQNRANGITTFEDAQIEQILDANHR